MRTVLFVISDLHYRYSARQLTLLATHLPRDAVRACVVVLGTNAAWAERLRQAGATVETLGWVRLVDPRPFFRLGGLIRSLRPDVIHVWDLPALRALLLTGGRGRARLVASRVCPRHWPDRLLLRRVDRILTLGHDEASLYQQAGIPDNRLVVGAPAINGNATAELSDDEGTDGVCSSALPAGARVVVGIGPITWLKGFRDAVWALDILNHIEDGHRLVLIGAAPEAERIARFGRAIGAMDRVHFTGPVVDLAPWLSRADIVWVPSWRGSGVGAALEAMAAGKPVVASRLPPLAEIVVDGQTGFLVPAEDRAALARQSLRLLKDTDLAARMGEAGRRRAAEVFSPQQLVNRCLALYD